MQAGTNVIRKSDLSKNLALFGIIDGFDRNGKAVVIWQYGNHHRSTLSVKSLIEATPDVQQSVREASKKRREEHQRKQMEERIYVCMNVNPQARISNDGHRKPMELAPGQVKDGCCWYCKAPVFNRCSVWDCVTPVAHGSKYCETHVKTGEEREYHA